MRILLAEHHIQVLRALHTLISEKTEHIIVAKTSDLDMLIEKAEKTQPDLILVDWDLPGQKGTDLLAVLRSVDCYPKLIVLSSQIDVKEKALHAGADAFVSKGDYPEKLLEALQVINVDLKTLEEPG